jgi:hypothetical protein
MTFIDAVIAISKDPTLSLCENDGERSGKYSICVYKGDECIGKLRWPRTTETGKVIAIATVDEAVEEVLGV